jgi:hypothetical protein
LTIVRNFSFAPQKLVLRQQFKDYRLPTGQAAE